MQAIHAIRLSCENTGKRILVIVSLYPTHKKYKGRAHPTTGHEDPEGE
jgi:hypothetical protein